MATFEVVSKDNQSKTKVKVMEKSILISANNIKLEKM